MSEEMVLALLIANLAVITALSIVNVMITILNNKTLKVLTSMLEYLVHSKIFPQ